jgi:hypothetical protein
MNALNIYAIAKELNNHEKTILVKMLNKDLTFIKKRSFNKTKRVSDEELDLFLLRNVFNVEV